jgi:hypothetical protein
MRLLDVKCEFEKTFTIIILSADWNYPQIIAYNIHVVTEKPVLPFITILLIGKRVRN